MKDVNIENIWTFELGVANGIHVPVYVLVAFTQRDQLDQLHQNIDTFYRVTVVNAQYKIGSKKKPDAGINCNFVFNKFSQAYGGIISCFRQLDRDNILQPYNTQKVFIISDNYPDGNPGCNSYDFDNRPLKDYSSAQPIKVRFDFKPAVPAPTMLIG